jgi:hypothetical protein
MSLIKILKLEHVSIYFKYLSDLNIFIKVRTCFLYFKYLYDFNKNIKVRICFLYFKVAEQLQNDSA